MTQHGANYRNPCHRGGDPEPPDHAIGRVPAAAAPDPIGVLADKAYSSAANRRYLTGRGIKATIPEREDQKAGRARRGSAGGRPRSFDAEAYRGRNVVERCFNGLKQWRGVTTRFDTTARSYLAGLTLAATLIWTR